MEAIDLNFDLWISKEISEFYSARTWEYSNDEFLDVMGCVEKGANLELLSNADICNLAQYFSIFRSSIVSHYPTWAVKQASRNRVVIDLERLLFHARVISTLAGHRSNRKLLKFQNNA